MLEKPDLQDDLILECLHREYGLMVRELRFLPLGADERTAVYRADAADGQPYFVKLRRGSFSPAAVRVPSILHRFGLRQVVPPLPTTGGGLWTELDAYTVVLSPYIEGRNGFERPLTDAQWVEFGTVLKSVHTAALPADLLHAIPQEKRTPHWRQAVTAHLARVTRETFSEPVAHELAAFLREHRAEVLRLVDLAERQAQRFRQKQPAKVLCHADIHVGNLHLAEDGRMYIIDWDTMLLAPRERDLMFIGAGLGDGTHSPEEEIDLFYRGYGTVEVDWDSIAFYRYERILEDIAIYCDQLLLSEAGGEDRAKSLYYLKSNFMAGGTIELATRADPTLI